MSERCKAIVDSWAFEDGANSIYMECIADEELSAYVAGIQNPPSFLAAIQRMVIRHMADKQFADHINCEHVWEFYTIGIDGDALRGVGPQRAQFKCSRCNLRRRMVVKPGTSEPDLEQPIYAEYPPPEMTQ